MKGQIFFFALVLSTIASADDFDAALRRMFADHGVRPLKQYRSDRPALVELGKKLFSDPILSGNRNISCQTCHHPDTGSGDALPLPIGEGGIGEGMQRQMGSGRIIARNAPPLWNLAQAPRLFWDGRVSYDSLSKSFITPEPKLNGVNPALPHYTAILDGALAAQAMFPPTSHDEMSGLPGENEIADAPDNISKWQRLTARVVADDHYRGLLQAAYPQTTWSDFNFAHLARAIAEFEKVEFQAYRTGLDLFLQGDNSAMSEKEKRGAHFFMTTAKCIACHHGPLLSDFKFHAIGLPQLGPGKDANHDDLGRMHVTQDPFDRYAFRTPPLRNVIKTAPWGHAGAFRDMRDLILHYFHPQRTFHHYTPDHSGAPYVLLHETQFNPQRFFSLDERVKVGFAMGQEEFAQLHDFIVFSLTDKPLIDKARQ